jgi:hypothetical protein
MTQFYLLKNLPAPVQALWRPMLLISLGLHGLFLAIPMPSEPKPQPPKKEPEKVKITQLPKTVPSPRSRVKPSPKLTPQSRQTPRVLPSPIRRPPSTIPPVTPRKQSVLRPSPSLSPSPSPSLSPSPSPATQPEQSASTTEPSPTTPEPTPSPTLQNPFENFPFPNHQQGSLGLLKGELDQAARNTSDEIDQVVGFYNKELPTRKFKFQPVNETAEFKVYQVSTEGADPQFLHLIPKDGKTVIVLASQEIKELKELKDAETLSPEELAFNSALEPIKESENFGAVDETLISKLPSEAQSAFADPNKFRGIIATTSFKPMSPEQLFSQVQNQLLEVGFDQVSPVDPYAGSLTYQVTKGDFTQYLYFIANEDNKTIFFVSKDAP